jgi:hypothetical protein
MRKPANDLTHDVVVKVKPCHLTFLMSMVALDSVKSWDLCIVKAHAILSGICFFVSHFMGGIDTFFGLIWSHGGRIYVSNSTTTYTSKFGGPTPCV